MSKYEKITITIEKAALELIDKAATKTRRNRSNFLQVSGEKYAKEVINNA